MSDVRESQPQSPLSSATASARSLNILQYQPSDGYPNTLVKPVFTPVSETMPDIWFPVLGMEAILREEFQNAASVGAAKGETVWDALTSAMGNHPGTLHVPISIHGYLYSIEPNVLSDIIDDTVSRYDLSKWSGEIFPKYVDANLNLRDTTQKALRGSATSLYNEHVVTSRTLLTEMPGEIASRLPQLVAEGEGEISVSAINRLTNRVVRHLLANTVLESQDWQIRFDTDGRSEPMISISNEWLEQSVYNALEQSGEALNLSVEVSDIIASVKAVVNRWNARAGRSAGWAKSTGLAGWPVTGETECLGPGHFLG